MTENYEDDELLSKFISDIGNRLLFFDSFQAVYDMFANLELPENGLVDSIDAYRLITYPQVFNNAAVEFKEIELRGVTAEVPYSAKSAIEAIEIFSFIVQTILVLKFERRWASYDAKEPNILTTRERHKKLLERIEMLLSGVEE
ncbi:MAG: hypothetical protein GY746_10215 [Gammaproteobacteria bacterium]|nr:hypothetical protein [Gammaproteobacteria bacterium]